MYFFLIIVLIVHMTIYNIDLDSSIIQSKERQLVNSNKVESLALLLIKEPSYRKKLEESLNYLYSNKIYEKQYSLGEIEDVNIDRRALGYVSLKKEGEGYRPVVKVEILDGRITYISEIYFEYLNEILEDCDNQDLYIRAIEIYEDNTFDVNQINTEKRDIDHIFVNNSDKILLESITFSDKVLTRYTNEKTYLKESYRKSGTIIEYRNKDKKGLFEIGNPKSETSLKSYTGIIYVEGDLIIHQDLTVYGIVIVNNGKILLDNGVKFTIMGKLIVDENTSRENFKYVYSLSTVINYGPYLPEFLDLKPKKIKSI